MPISPWAKKLRQLRAVHNYTQEHLAEELGIRQNTYSLLETGTTEPTEERLAQIAEVYDMSLEEMRAWEPGAVNQNHNNVANAYTTIEHQHIISREFIEDLMTRMDKRSEETNRVNAELLRLNQRLLDLVEQLKG